MTTDSTKGRIDSEANQRGIALVQTLLTQELHEKLQPGVHGTICLKASIRDGTIQGIENAGTASYRN